MRFTVWLVLVTHWKSKRCYSVDHKQVIMTKIPLKTTRMQRNYPQMFLLADDQDKKGFKLENAGSSYTVIAH